VGAEVSDYGPSFWCEPCSPHGCQRDMVPRLGLQATSAYNLRQFLQKCPERKTTYNQADKPRATDVSMFSTSTSLALFAAHTVRLKASSSDNAIRLYGAANGTRFELVKAEPYGYDILVDCWASDWL
jgi:hypothetical protein